MSKSQQGSEPDSAAGTADGSHRRIIAGTAVGIGSAAIVAALMFAGRGKPAKPPAPDEPLSE